MKKFMSMLLVMCSLFCILSTTAITASAAEYSVPRTYVSIWRDGKYVDVVAWYEEDGSFYLEDYTDLTTVFPVETANTYFVSDGPAGLGPYAKKYGYSMTLEGGNKLILTKNGNNSGNNGGGNNGGEVTIPRTYLTVYKADKYVDVTAWVEENGNVYLSGYQALQTLFPDETAGMSFVTVIGPVGLKNYADQFGYTLKVTNDKRLLVTKNNGGNNGGGNNGGEITIPRTYLTVYKADKYVDVTAWVEENGTVYLSGYSALQKLFPDETAGVVFPTEVTPVSLKDYANQFGYTYKVKNKNLYLTKSIVDPNKRTDLTVYRDGKRISATAWQIGDTVYVKNFTDLFKIFGEETKLHKVPDVKGEVVLSNYANQFGCSISVNNGRLDVTTEKVNTNGVEIWINGEKLAIPKNIPEPFVTNGTTLVPVRLVTEALGADVNWYQSDPHDLVTVTRDGVSLMIYVGTKDYICNGKAGKAGTETVYKTINGNTSTMLPLRVISESFGASITWDSRTSRVIIIDEYLMKK